MNNFDTKITYLIEKHKKTNEKLLPCLYQKKLFNFVNAIISEDWSECKKVLAYGGWITSTKMESLLIENLLQYINVILFNEINNKLQINKENSKTTKIKFNDLNKVSGELLKSKVEKYDAEVESLLREILKSEFDNKNDLKITMLLSNDFSNLLDNKSNDGLHEFTKFNNLLREYHILRINHDFLNKSNDFLFTSGAIGFPKAKINLNLKNNIILLLITKKQNDFRLQIDNTIELSKHFQELNREDCTAVKINFNAKKINLPKVTIFAIKS